MSSSKWNESLPVAKQDASGAWNSGDQGWKAWKQGGTSGIDQHVVDPSDSHGRANSGKPVVTKDVSDTAMTGDK